MKKLIASILILSFLPLQGFGAFTNSDRAEFTGRNLLADKNPGAENGKAGWTLSAGTFTASTSSPLEGGASFVWDATATSQTFTGTAVTIPEGWKGQNGVVSCRFQCASGTCTHTLTAWDGSANIISPVTITSATVGAPRTSVNFTFPQSGTIAPRVTSAAVEPSLKTDSCIIGLASDINLSQVNQASLVGTASFANTASCTWSRTSATLGEASTTAACPGPTIETNVGPGTIQTTDTDLPRVTVNSLPPGTYWVSYDGTASIATSAQEGAMAINDGTTTFGTTGMQWAVGGAHFHVEGAVTYTATANVTFKLYLSSTANAVSISNNGNNEATHFTIMRFPTTSEMAYRPEIYNWRVDATINGANANLGTVDVASYTGIEDSGLTLANNTSTTGNVLTAQIPCSSTNAPTGTTCAAGNESLGVSFTLPAIGDVEACAQFTHFSKAGATGDVAASFELVETPNNAQTVSQAGKHQSQSGVSTASTSGSFPHSQCGIFSFTSAGQKTIRLFYQQDITATVTNNLILGVDSGLQPNNVRWTVRPVTQGVPNPVLVGGVSIPQNTAGATVINNWVGKTSSYTATTNDETIEFTSGSDTLTLPAAASVPGKIYNVIGGSAVTSVTIDPNASETVCGQTTIVLLQGESGSYQSDAGNWKGIGDSSCRAFRSASINCDASGSINSQVGNWLSSVGNVAGGVCNINFTSSSEWSAAPNCTATIIGTTLCHYWNTITTSLAPLGAFNCSTNAAANHDDQIICTGPR